MMMMTTTMMDFDNDVALSAQSINEMLSVSILFQRLIKMRRCWRRSKSRFPAIIQQTSTIASSVDASVADAVDGKPLSHQPPSSASAKEYVSITAWRTYLLMATRGWSSYNFITLLTTGERMSVKGILGAWGRYRTYIDGVLFVNRK